MIDKNKAYRFRGDSERWVKCRHSKLWYTERAAIPDHAFEHLHERGILLEYPELPGEDWEFCEASEQEQWWCEGENISEWDTSHDKAPIEPNIYCRKKKPVYPSGKIEVGCRIPFVANLPIYWTTDPEKGKELLS